jgi:hypothetical protein
MADGSFEDSVHHAIGLLTPAERQAENEAKAERQKALQDDRPRRDALRAEFQRDRNPLICQVLATLQPIFDKKESTFSIGENNYPFPLPDSIVVQRSFVISEKHLPNKRGRQVSPLLFDLLPDGRVRVSAPDVSSAPPTLKVAFPLRFFSTAELDIPKIQEIFHEYVKVAAQSLQ